MKDIRLWFLVAFEFLRARDLPVSWMVSFYGVLLYLQLWSLRHVVAGLLDNGNWFLITSNIELSPFERKSL